MFVMASATAMRPDAAGFKQRKRCSLTHRHGLAMVPEK
jgi:hypothetical protein